MPRLVLSRRHFLEPAGLQFNVSFFCGESLELLSVSPRLQSFTGAKSLPAVVSVSFPCLMRPDVLFSPSRSHP